jgi:hypothetical protein
VTNERIRGFFVDGIGGVRQFDCEVCESGRVAVNLITFGISESTENNDNRADTERETGSALAGL